MTTAILNSLQAGLKLNGFNYNQFKQNTFNHRHDYKDVGRGGFLLDVPSELKNLKTLRKKLEVVKKRKDLHPPTHITVDDKFLLWMGYLPLKNYQLLQNSLQHLHKLTLDIFDDIEIFRKECLQIIEGVSKGDKTEKDLLFLSNALNNQLRLLLNKRTDKGIVGIGSRIPKGRSLFDFQTTRPQAPVAVETFTLEEADKVLNLYENSIKLYSLIRPNVDKFEEVGNGLAELLMEANLHEMKDNKEFNIFHYTDELAKVFKGILITLLPYVQVISALEHIFNRSIDVLVGEST